MRNQPHKPTSADIARFAGVSRSTVSRVINGYSNVPEETCKRVRETIEKHGYYPSVSGQMLKGKRARCVGVFLEDTGLNAETQAELLYAFSASAQAHGYMTLLGSVGGFDTPACARAVREVLCSGCVDAGVFFNAKGSSGLIRQLLSEGQTIGALGCQPDTREERLFTVGFDNGIVQKAVEYTLSLGHKRIALIYDYASHPDCIGLCERFCKAAENAGISITCPQYDSENTVNRQAGYTLDHMLKPMLMVCADQPSVFAAYRAAYARGLIIGADVSILGVGVMAAELPLWPTLSGFRFDSQEMITSLAAHLIQGLEGKADAPRHTQLAYRWMAGESCVRCLPETEIG